jgi:hypothetical protein
MCLIKNMNIDLSKVSAVTNSSTKQYMKPGIREVEIVSFEQFTAQNGNLSIIGTFVDTVTGGVHEEYFPCSDVIAAGKEKSPFDISKQKLSHIGSATIGDENLVKLSGDNLDEFINSLNTYLVGCKYRQKFSGEEKKSQNDRIYAITRIPLPNSFNPMAEPLTVPMDDTKLKYDPTNPYDLKKYTQLELGTPMTFEMPQSDGTGLPF